MSATRPVTLQDIADRAQVSRSTVSLALRNSTMLRKEIVARVQQTAAEMGYRPNPLVTAHMSQLRRKKTKKFQGELAFVSHYSQEVLIAHLSPEENIYRHASKRAHDLGYQLTFMWQHPQGLSEGRLNSILVGRNVPGVIVGPQALPVSKLSLDWSRFATVSWSYTLTEPALHRVTHDYYDGIFSIMHELRRRGYRRIGLCLEEYEDIRNNHFLISAYLYCQHSAPSSERLPYLAAARFEDGSLLKWYKRHRPDAIIASEYRAYKLLKEAGVNMPDDVGLALSHNEGLDMNVSGMLYDHQAIGINLVDTVVGQLNNNERGIPAKRKNILVPGKWNPGATLRQPSGCFE